MKEKETVIPGENSQWTAMFQEQVLHWSACPKTRSKPKISQFLLG